MKPHKVIGPAERPYMYRWFLFKVGNLPRVYLHKFLRSDDDRALHDHPWWFISIILRGGYVEISETTDGAMTVLCRTSIFDWRSPFRLRSIAFRPATYRHRVALPIVDGVEQPCWTLFIAGPVRRMWGFWCGEQLIEWHQFDGCDS